jgi:hypothetical protein
VTGKSSRKSYKLLESLPPYSRHALRVRVFHHILAREVEFRILPEGSDPDTQTLFFRELKDLINLDHPAFLPVLQRGKIRGLHCYTVPLRFHATLGNLHEDETLRMEDRARALRSLASALCAAHHQDMLIGGISTRLIAWDPVAGTSYYLHHRPTSSGRPDLSGLPLPEDVVDTQGRSKPADVYHWAVLAYRLLSRGRLPQPGKNGKITPLRELAPALDRGFAATIETCLSKDPGLRPQDGAELNTLLQMEFQDRDGTSDEGQVVDLAPELSMSVAADLITQSLRKLRKTGRIPAAPAAPEPDPARAASGEGLPEEVFGSLSEGVVEPDDEALRSGTNLLRQGEPSDPPGLPEPEEDQLAESSAHPPPAKPPERPARRRPPDPPSGVQQIAVAPPKPPPRPLGLSGASPMDLKRSGLLLNKRRPALLEGVVAGFVLGFAVGGWSFYLFGGSPAAPPTDAGGRPVFVQPGTPTPTEDDPAPVGEVSPLPPSVQARYHEDRFIRRLARRTEVPPERFDETWKVVRMLSIRKRLPPSINDRRRIMAIRKAFDEDADAGARDLMALLDDLRTVVGTPVGDSGQWR